MFFKEVIQSSPLDGTNVKVSFNNKGLRKIPGWN